MARKQRGQQKIISEIRKYKAKKAYKIVHIVINPASGKNEPILNVVNSVFSKHDIDWSVSVTKKFGDATRLAKAAAKKVDLVAGYGGDGTQHEIINAVYGTGVTVGILPGGTGNGFAAGLGLPETLEESLELIATSKSIAKIDIVDVGKKFFLSRLYTGIEPEEQTSRESKDKYGVFAYAISGLERRKTRKVIDYELTIDNKKIKTKGLKLYVVNSASTGVKIPIGDALPTDGILDVFLLDEQISSVVAVAERTLDIQGKLKGHNYWTGKKITIKTTPSQAVWADGEYIGRTPLSIKVIHKAVDIVVPE
jgi:diacylglycerol kinase (ATP)